MFIPRKFISNSQLYTLGFVYKSHIEKEKIFFTSYRADNGTQGLGRLVVNSAPALLLYL